MVDVDWPSVVLLLGIVGMSLGTVCFSIWIMKRPSNKQSLVEHDEQPTQTWPMREQQ
jgi:hypothetical protein